MKRLTLITCLVFSMFSQTRQTDSLALVALYNSTNGANWTTNTNWLSSEPLDKWFGITILNNRVDKIDLDNNNLTGSIPTELGDLSMLQILLFKLQ